MLFRSLWIKKPRAKKEDFDELCEEIRQETGLPLSFEGIYKWIAFLPSRMHEDVTVLNRYFGVFEDDKMKLRGIELRRRDTIKLIADCQREILETFSFAGTAEEVMNLIPEALRILKSYVGLIRDGKVHLTDLIIVNSLSKNFNEYTSNISQAAAVKQLADEGLELMAGQSVSYVITKFSSRNPREKVRPVQLLNPSVRYDKERYVALLLRGIASILQPFGYNEGHLFDTTSHTSVQMDLLSIAESSEKSLAKD